MTSQKSEKMTSLPNVTGLVLVMIVKNESRIIARCLDQIKGVVKGVCITDTGSTDNCVDCIYKWCKENEMPCRVPIGEFKNFGYSRTLSFLNAKKYFPNASYYLLLDADNNLVVESDWDETELTHDGYNVYLQSKANRYQNTKLLKASKNWRCIGVTHEYWKCQDAKIGVLHSLWIDDKDDGGCKDDKYTRDRRLLLEGIADKKTPDDLRARYRFYLAQTYYYLRDYNSSIDEYQKRIDMGGWDEELWFSQFRIGECYFALKSSKGNGMAVDAMLKAWNMRPHRAEPLHKLSEHYRNRGLNHLAYEFAKIGSEVGYPIGDSLFIDVPTYAYLLDLDLSISSFYVGKKRLGCQAHQRLKSIYDKLPRWVQACVDNNNKFYLC